MEVLSNMISNQTINWWNYFNFEVSSIDGFNKYGWKLFWKMEVSSNMVCWKILYKKRFKTENLWFVWSISQQETCLTTGGYHMISHDILGDIRADDSYGWFNISENIPIFEVIIGLLLFEIASWCLYKSIGGRLDTPFTSWNHLMWV